MSKNLLFGGMIAVALIGGGVFIVSQQKQETQTPQEAVQNTVPPQEQTAAKNTDESPTTVIAGTTSQYLAFSQPAYVKALAEKKVILLNFYADWCPICRAEEPDVKAAFDGLQNDTVIGFQVNFKDNQTDAAEKALAQEFGVPYQHTKVILKDGKQVLKETAQWKKQQFVDALNAATR